MYDVISGVVDLIEVYLVKVLCFEQGYAFLKCKLCKSKSFCLCYKNCVISMLK